MNSVGFLETLWQDLRYGMRGLRLSPGFTAVAVLSLALGIGANTAIFQLFDAVRLKLLPVKNPEQLAEVIVPSQIGKGNHIGRRPTFTYAIWQEIERQLQVFSSMAAWMNISFNLAPTGEQVQPDPRQSAGNELADRLVALTVLLFAYFLPNFIAEGGRLQNAGSIFLINLFLG